MTIEINYQIGEHIWVVYEYQGEVQIHDDYIESFNILKDEQFYTTKEGYIELKEDEIILYEDKEKLYKTICKKMEEIREKEVVK